MPERGVIRNREFKRQIVDFSGIRFGNITPTDLDAFMDFGNRLFVFVETKFNGASMPYGQRLAIERLCDACNTPPDRYSVAFITSHHSEGDIDFANTVVTEYRWQGKWIKPNNKDKTLYDGIVIFRELTLHENVVPL
jgi:hypothetical protein